MLPISFCLTGQVPGMLAPVSPLKMWSFEECATNVTKDLMRLAFSITR